MWAFSSERRELSSYKTLERGLGGILNLSNNLILYNVIPFMWSLDNCDCHILNYNPLSVSHCVCMYVSEIPHFIYGWMRVF